MLGNQPESEYVKADVSPTTITHAFTVFECIKVVFIHQIAPVLIPRESPSLKIQDEEKAKGKTEEDMADDAQASIIALRLGLTNTQIYHFAVPLDSLDEMPQDLPEFALEYLAKEQGIFSDDLARKGFEVFVEIGLNHKIYIIFVSAKPGVIRTMQNGKEMDSEWNWLIRHQLEQCTTQMKVIWDLYLKFYIAFLALNIAGLGLVIQYVGNDRRWPIIVAFIIHNSLSSVTAIGIGKFTNYLAIRSEHLATMIAKITSPDSEDSFNVCSSLIPKRLGVYVGYANSITHVGIILCWLGVWFLIDGTPKL